MVKLDLKKLNEKLKISALELKRKFNERDTKELKNILPESDLSLVNETLVRKEILANRHFIETGFKASDC